MITPSPFEYLAAALAFELQDRDGERPTDFRELYVFYNSRFGINLSDKALRAAVRVLSSWGFVDLIEDRYAGVIINYYPTKVVIDAFSSIAGFKGVNPSLGFFRKGGGALLQRAFDSEEFWHDVENQLELDAEENSSQFLFQPNSIPASDRIVQLNDNQIAEIDLAAQNLHEALASQNSIDGDPEARARFSAEISAARELLRAGSVRAYLMYETLFHLLTTLVTKYGQKALGQAASKLLDLLLEHICGK